jgi:serine/threonine protein phosphatase 1
MIYAIGDVHGELEALQNLLTRLPLEPTDLVIFMGDIINRGGKDSFKCVEEVIRFDQCRKICLQGNHEEAMRNVLEGDINAMSGMAFDSTVLSYEAAGYPIVPGDPASIPESHGRFYFQAEEWTLPFYITDNYIFTHAGWDLSQPLELQIQERWRWGRVKGFEHPVWTQTVVRGHTPMPKVTHAKAKRSINIDTGCGMGGYLSAIELPGEHTYSIKPTYFDVRWYYALKK